MLASSWVFAISMAFGASFVSLHAIAAETNKPIDHNFPQAVGAAGAIASTVSTSPVPCWGLSSNEDPRRYQAYQSGLPIDTLFATIDARLGQLRALVVQGKLEEAFPDKMSRSFFRNTLTVVGRRRFDAQFPPSANPIDWNKVWLHPVEFEKMYDRILGTKKPAIESLKVAFSEAETAPVMDKVTAEVNSLSLVQLEMVKELMLRESERRTHQRVVARAKQGDLSPKRSQDKRFSFEYAESDEATLWRRHLDELKLYCSGAPEDTQTRQDLIDLNILMAEFSHRLAGARGAHGLPSALRTAFLRLSPEVRTAVLTEVREHLALLQENGSEVAPETALLAHRLLANGFGEKTFSSEFLRAWGEMLALSQYRLATRQAPPSDREAKLLAYQAKIIAHLESALDKKVLREEVSNPKEVLLARAMLVELQTMTGPKLGGDTGEAMLASALDEGAKLAQKYQDKDEGAYFANLALAAHASLGPGGQAQHGALANALAANVVDEKRNSSWRKTFAHPSALHRLAEAAIESARYEEARDPGARASVNEKRAKAMELINGIETVDYPRYYAARYQLAQLALQVSDDTNLENALRAIEGLPYPKGRGAGELDAYLRSKLLEARLHATMGHAEKIGPLVAEVDKAPKDHGTPITDPELEQSLNRLRPTGIVHKAKEAFRKGSFAAALKHAETALSAVEKSIDKLWVPDPKDPNAKIHTRDPALEMDYQDLLELSLRAKIRTGHAANTAMNTYGAWLRALGPLSIRERHDRLLESFRAELDGLSPKAARTARRQYREFLTMGIFKGMPRLTNHAERLWEPPADLLDTRRPDILETYRFVGMGLSLLGESAKRSGEDSEAVADHEGAGVLLSRIAHPRIKETHEIFGNLNSLESRKTVAQQAGDVMGEKVATQELNVQHRLLDELRANQQERQYLRAIAAREFRLASGGNPQSRSFNEARHLLEEMMRQAPNEGGAGPLTIGGSPLINHYIHILNEFQDIWVSPLSVHAVEGPRLFASRKGTTLAMGDVTVNRPHNPSKCREELINAEPANLSDRADVVDRQIDKFWFGALDPTARAELALLWEDAAKFAEKQSDPLTRLNYYGAAMTAANIGMEGWVAPQGSEYRRARTWALWGWKDTNTDAQFHENYHRWLTYSSKWLDAVVAMKKTRPGDVKISSKDLGEGAREIIMGVLQVQKSDPARWEKMKDVYLPMRERARQVLIADPRGTGGLPLAN